MEYKTILAKCPYCKNEFGWNCSVIGEYALSSTKEKCDKCGNISIIKATQIMKFSAKKSKSKK